MALPRTYLDNLTTRLEDAFGECLTGVCLSGSASIGAYEPGRSDLDVLVAVKGADRPALERVVELCSHSALPCPATKLELVVYEIEVLRSPGEQPRWSLNLNTGEHAQLAEFDPQLEPAHWFVLDLAFVSRHGTPLTGPPSSELVQSPPDDAIGRAFDAMVGWYAEHEPGELPVAQDRAEHWHRTGTFKAKLRSR